MAPITAFAVVSLFLGSSAAPFHGTLRIRHEAPVAAVAFAPDGKLLASAGADGTVRLSDTAGGKEVRRLTAHQAPVQCLAFSPDGRLLASAGGDARGRHAAIHLWDIASGRELRRLVGHRWPVTAVTFSHDGRFLASASGDQTLRLWDPATGHEIRRLEGHDGFINSANLSPDGRLLVSGGGDALVRIWDTATGKEVRHLRGHYGSVAAVAFSPDGMLVASGSGDPSGRDRTICLWEVATGQAIRQINTGLHRVRCLAFAPDGRTLASGGGDHTIRLWEVATRREVRILSGHEGAVTSLGFAPDGKRLASGSEDTTVILWDVAMVTGRPPELFVLAATDVERLWNDLASDDAVTAYQAVWALASDPRRSVPFLSSHVRPVVAADRSRLAALLADLNSDRFGVREKATRELEKLGESAVPALSQALAGRPSAEVRRRVEQLLDGLREPSGAPESLRPLRAVAVLEHARTPESRRVLEVLSGGIPEARLSSAAKAAVSRLSR